MLWIVTATPWESRPLASGLGLSEAGDAGCTGTVGGREVVLMELGIGPERAQKSLARALEVLPRPAWLVHAGFVGAVQPGVPAGTLVFDVWGQDTEARDRAKTVAADLGLPYQLGRIASSKEPLNSAADKAAFGRAQRAVAADLENDTVRAWAKAQTIPFLAVKAVWHDVTAEVPAGLPQGAGFSDVAGYVKQNWSELPALMKLWNKQRGAAGNLTRFLKAYLPQL